MLNRLKISLVLIPLAILLAVGIYVYSLWAEEKRRAADLPVEAASIMMRELLRFHGKRGGFPSDLKQMEGKVWEKKEGRSYSVNNRGLSHRNYFYLYTRLSPHRFTLWAVPMGQVRDDAQTWFLMVTPESGRRWKGGALSLEDAKKIAVSPSIPELAFLGLTEQPKIVFPRE
jgi:hypothetical protein